MRSGGLLALIAGQLVLAAAEPYREIQAVQPRPHALSNVELLVPLVVSGAGERLDDDAPFSSIPDSAFTLDEQGSGSQHQRAHRVSNSRKREHEHGALVLAACSRVLRSLRAPQLYLVLLLCSELLDAAAPPEPPAPPAPPAPCDARRDLIPMGNNADMVQRYMNMPRRRRPRMQD